jgi:hypothetical protein
VVKQGVRVNKRPGMCLCVCVCVCVCMCVTPSLSTLQCPSCLPQKHNLSSTTWAQCRQQICPDRPSPDVAALSRTPHNHPKILI